MNKILQKSFSDVQMTKFKMYSLKQVPSELCILGNFIYLKVIKKVVFFFGSSKIQISSYFPWLSFSLQYNSKAFSYFEYSICFQLLPDSTVGSNLFLFVSFCLISSASGLPTHPCPHPQTQELPQFPASPQTCFNRKTIPMHQIPHTQWPSLLESVVLTQLALEPGISNSS